MFKKKKTNVILTWKAWNSLALSLDKLTLMFGLIYLYLIRKWLV